MHIHKIKVYALLALHLHLRQITFSISKPSRDLKQAGSAGYLSHKLRFDFQNHTTWAEHNFGRCISICACHSVKLKGWTQPSQISTTRLLPIYKYWRYISCSYPHYISFNSSSEAVSVTINRSRTYWELIFRGRSSPTTLQREMRTTRKLPMSCMQIQVHMTKFTLCSTKTGCECKPLVYYFFTLKTLWWNWNC